MKKFNENQNFRKALLSGISVVALTAMVSAGPAIAADESANIEGGAGATIDGADTFTIDNTNDGEGDAAARRGRPRAVGRAGGARRRDPAARPAQPRPDAAPHQPLFTMPKQKTARRAGGLFRVALSVSGPSGGHSSDAKTP